MGRHVIACVSQSALKHNLKRTREIAPRSKILAMVKANAYGHGLVQVVNVIRDVDALGVASIEEALNIRRAGLQTDIVLMEGIFRNDELDAIVNHHLIQVIHHWPQIEALENYPHIKPGVKFKVWIKVNTGINRLGFQPSEFHDAYNILMGMPHVEVIGFMTHFAKADETQNDFTIEQYKQFSSIVGERKGERCLANSAGILGFPQTHADWIRPGLMLYGASPFADSCGKEFDLIPAMSLTSAIITIRQVNAGEIVGYSGTWESKRPVSKIGIVAMGYGDGYPWHAKNGTPILVNDQRAETVGKISMDMLAVDITHLENVKVGDPVTLWGPNLPIEEVARHAGTVPYELFCRFTERVTVQAVK